MISLKATFPIALGEAVSKPLLFGSLIAIGSANGLSEKVLTSVSLEGFLGAALNTFDVSVFVWLALAAGLLLVYRSSPEEIRASDWALAAGAGIGVLLPVPALSWLVVTGLSLSLLIQSAPGSSLRRGAIILLAATIPVFWARLVMSVFNEAVLAIDAFLVSLAVGSARNGNLVPFADGSGALWIAPGCSSFTNISLAILAFVGLVNITSGKWSSAKLGMGLLACAAVMLINVTRISLIGYYPEHFELIHGETGAGIAGWLATLAIVAIGWLAVRSDAIDLG